MSISYLKALKSLFSRLFSGVIVMLTPGLALAEYGINFPPPVTEVAQDILTLHNTIFFICTGILILVFLVMFISILLHRKSRGRQAAKFHDNTTLEVVWTVIPFLILVGMAIPSTATLLKMEDTTGSEMTLKITGYQWKWKYDYPDHGLSYFSNLSTPREQIEGTAEKTAEYLLEVDNPVVLPVGKKIRLVFTANDVIHAWWVPQLGVKKDAIPGFTNELWTRIDKPGIYRGQCAELCGKDHGFMPIVVQAVEEDEFKKWVSVQKNKMMLAQADAGKSWGKTELLEHGKSVYDKNCAACHGLTGAGVPGAFPAMTGSKIVNGPIKDHINIVLNGKSGTAMAAFKGQLNDVDLAAVISYERNALGNSAGDMIQPSKIKALR